MTVASRTERASTDSSADGGRIELVSLRKSSGSQLVLKGIDLMVESGEFFSLLGPSGCDKTTIDGAGWDPAPDPSVGVRVPASAVRILERR